MERLQLPGKEVVLVGTAHISRESIEQVKAAIATEKPDTVGVELDLSRLKQLKLGQRWQQTNVLHVIKSGQGYLFLLNLLLANFQRRLGEAIGVKPGEEMLEAVNAAEAAGARVALLDRDVKVTLKRAMARMSFIEKMRLLGNVFAGVFEKGEPLTREKIEELKQKDVLNKLLEELSAQAPAIKEVLVDERDKFIANQILAAPAQKMVAVVGAGHVEGIKRFLDRPRDVAPLLAVPKKKSVLSFAKFVVPLLFAYLLFVGFSTKGLEASIEILAAWFLINGFLAAAGALLAGGHVFSAAAAFFAAPFTSLHPALAAGWFAGFVEAKMRPPLVADFESLNALNGFRDFQRNRATRVVLVTALANVGSTIGTVIALPYILSLLS